MSEGEIRNRKKGFGKILGFFGEGSGSDFNAWAIRKIGKREEEGGGWW